MEALRLYAKAMHEYTRCLLLAIGDNRILPSKATLRLAAVAADVLLPFAEQVRIQHLINSHESWAIAWKSLADSEDLLVIAALNQAIEDSAS